MSSVVRFFSDFCAVLFPVDLDTKRAIIGCGQQSVFASALTLGNWMLLLQNG